MTVSIHTVRRFHLIRLIIWSVQVPLACFTPLRSSLVYLVFLSVAALIESSLTDYVQARIASRQDPTAEV